MKQTQSDPQKFKHEDDSQEFSPEESQLPHPRPAREGGGHRSGSRGAGTWENSDGEGSRHRSGPSRPR